MNISPVQVPTVSSTRARAGQTLAMSEIIDGRTKELFIGRHSAVSTRPCQSRGQVAM